MAEMAVSFALDKLFSLLREEAYLPKGVYREFVDIKLELESIQAFLKDADRVAASEGENKSGGVKTWVKQVIEVAYHIEHTIDEYNIYVGQQPRHPGCAASICKIAHVIKTLKHRHHIASNIRDIKSSLHGIKERSERYGFQSRGSQNAKWHDPRMASRCIEGAEVVGFEAPTHALIDWLIKGRAERGVICVEGMGGQGKTTLAKKVFDSNEVIEHFDCRVWITVSQSRTYEGLLMDMLRKFYKQKGDSPPQYILQMSRRSLIGEVRNYLQQKRYVIVFDDVRDENFWDDIKLVVTDNRNGSRIFITTRRRDVTLSCQKSPFAEVHVLQPLTEEQSLELFHKKAFHFDFDGCCPKELIHISSEIVKVCKGLPLAIVAIGGLLSKKKKNAFEWQRFNDNLSLEIGVKEILDCSYNDLPYYLKSCLLYFGIYPKDYVVNSKRLIWQWIAEGFVKEERGKTLEEVAEGYLTELIHRSLVQVSSISIDGKAKGCHVHDLLREMILEKFEDFIFGRHISKDGHSSLSGIIRRLSIATSSNNLMESIGSSHVQSLLFFTDKALPEYFVRKIPTKYKLLKVLDFEDARLFNVPTNLEHLIHLKYLSFKYARLEQSELPKSIGMLQNLETLDLRATRVYEVPKEISKLRKLRHLLGNRISLIQLKDGIGGMTSLQTLRYVELGGHGAAKLIRELEKLKQLRELCLVDVRGEHGSPLSSLINEMQHLEKVCIQSKSMDEVIDLHFISSPPPMLRNLRLHVKLEKLPEWIPKLQNLVKLTLAFSHLTDDPMKSLKNMQNLLSISITDHAYEGECLHFQDGGFQKLKELYLENSTNLNSIFIDKGALHSLKKLELWYIPQLKTVPAGIQHLEQLEILSIGYMPTKFVKSIAPDEGKEHSIIERVPLVAIYTSGGKFIQRSRS